MAQESLDTSRSEIDCLEQELKILLLPHDPNDDRSVIMEIRAGAGGEEAALFAHSLYRMYTMYADKRGWKTEVINLAATELGGCAEITFSVDGEGAYSRLELSRAVSTAFSAYRRPNRRVVSTPRR